MNKLEAERGSERGSVQPPRLTLADLAKPECAASVLDDLKALGRLLNT